MTVSPEPPRSRGNWLRPRLVYLWVLLISLASLWFPAYELWTGPTPGWAAPAFSFVGFLVFCDWVASGAPAALGPHDPHLGRYETVACAAGLLANILLIAGLVLGPLGIQRLARTFGRVALGSAFTSIIFMKIGVTIFEFRLGGYLWLAAMALLAFTRLNRPDDPPAMTVIPD